MYIHLQVKVSEFFSFSYVVSLLFYSFFMLLFFSLPILSQGMVYHCPRVRPISEDQPNSYIPSHEPPRREEMASCVQVFAEPLHDPATGQVSVCVYVFSVLVFEKLVIGVSVHVYVDGSQLNLKIVCVSDLSHYQI